MFYLHSTNYIIMNLNELKDKYKKAHEAYLKYKDNNRTNSIEASYLPEVVALLKDVFPNCNIITLGDNILNYLGIDIIIDDNGKQQMFLDLKVCQYCHDKEVVIDAYKHDKNGNWFPAQDVKLNDWFCFLNADNIILVPSSFIKIPPMDQCFFYKRDLYKTTMKATIDLSNVRKRVFKRTH